MLPHYSKVQSRNAEIRRKSGEECYDVGVGGADPLSQPILTAPGINMEFKRPIIIDKVRRGGGGSIEEILTT